MGHLAVHPSDQVIEIFNAINSLFLKNITDVTSVSRCKKRARNPQFKVYPVIEKFSS